MRHSRPVRILPATAIRTPKPPRSRTFCGSSSCISPDCGTNIPASPIGGNARAALYPYSDPRPDDGSRLGAVQDATELGLALSTLCLSARGRPLTGLSHVIAILARSGAG